MRISRVLALSSFAAVLLGVAAIPVSADPTAAPPAMAPAAPAAHTLIKVSSCSASLNMVQSPGYSNGYYRGGRWGDPWGAAYYQPPVTTAQPQMAVDWTNITHKVMTEVQFGLIANGILKAEAKDMGKFSPNAEIKHKYGIPTSTFPLSTGLPQCVPLHIQFADGTKWRNPKLPPKNQHIYLNP